MSARRHSGDLLGVIVALWPPVRQYPWTAGLLIASLTASVIVSVVFSLSLQILFDETIPARDVTQLAIVIGTLLVLLIGTSVVAYFQAKLAATLTANVVRDIQSRLIDQVLHLPASYFTKTAPGSILASFSTDLEPIAYVAGSYGPYLVMYSFVLLACMGAMAWIDGRAAFLTLLMFPVALLGRSLAGRAAKATKDFKTAESRVLAAAQDTVRNESFIRAFGIEKFFAARFQTAAQHQFSMQVRASFLVQIWEMIAMHGSMFLAVVAIGAAAWLAVARDITPGAFAAVLMLIFYVQDAAYQIAYAGSGLLWASGGMARIRAFLAIEREDPGDPAAQVAALQHAIRFEDVAFAYGDNEPVLSGLSFTIARGETVAIVGRSGAGKSTLLSRLMRFADPEAGRITWDGIDLSEVSRASLRSQLGVVFQEPLLIGGPSSQVLRVGRPEASEEELEDAIARADLAEVVKELPDGLDTRLGEGSHILSSGQKQRFALAQAILRRPSVLILDEVTSALDPAAEAEIIEGIEGAAPTIIAASHRLNIAKRADRILVLHAGTIVENGTHEALIAAGGVYAHMYARQSGSTPGGSAATAKKGWPALAGQG